MEAEETARTLRNVGIAARKPYLVNTPKVKERARQAEVVIQGGQKPDDLLAVEIALQHAECDRLQAIATAAIDAALNARFAASQLVEAAFAREGNSSAFVRWWKNQGLPSKWSEKYMTLARTKGRSIVANKSLLRLCGILPKAESGNSGNRRETSSHDWIRHVGKLRGKLTAEKINSLRGWDRDVAAKHLEPLVAIHRQLTR